MRPLLTAGITRRDRPEGDTAPTRAHVASCISSEARPASPMPRETISALRTPGNSRPLGYRTRSAAPGGIGARAARINREPHAYQHRTDAKTTQTTGPQGLQRVTWPAQFTSVRSRAVRHRGPFRRNEWAGGRRPEQGSSPLAPTRSTPLSSWFARGGNREDCAFLAGYRLH
jgi:hypothetical protein